MSDPPSFSVIMPVFNHARYLEEAVESVLAQTVEDWELIVVDDGSTDLSPEIIEKLCREHSRIRSFHQENRGAGAARNRGIGMARAQWLCYLDSDDVWFPETLDHYCRYIAAHPQARFIYGYRHRLEKDGRVTCLPAQYQDRPTGARELFQVSYLSPIRVCHRAELIRETGGYDENLPLCEDYDLFLRMSVHTAFEPIGKATGLRRRHDANISRQTGFSLSVEASVLLRFWEEYGKGYISRDEANDRLGKVLYAAGREYFHARQFRECTLAMRQARSYSLSLKGKMIEWLAQALSPFSATRYKKFT